MKYLKNEVFLKLRMRLAEIVQDEQEAESIVRQADLNRTVINFGRNRLMMMDAILSQADIEGKVIEVIEAAINNRGGDDKLEEIKKELESVKKEIKSGNYLVSTYALKESSPGKNLNCILLIIYHDKDIDRCKELKSQFRIFVLNEQLTVKDFQNDIKHGNVQVQRIELVNGADIVMPVISSNFFDPDEDYLQLVRSAIEGNKKVVPVLLDHCLYSRVKVLKDYLTLPPLGKFLADYENKEKGYLDVAEGIEKLLETC